MLPCDETERPLMIRLAFLLSAFLLPFSGAQARDSLTIGIAEFPGLM